MTSRWNLRYCDDESLIDGLHRLVRSERHTLSDVLAHVAEVDARKLYAERAYSSMLQYCVERLGYSEGAARHRIRAARLARRFPVIFDDVAAGRFHLAGLNALARHLTDANHVELLKAAAGCTRAEIEELVAARSPVSDEFALIMRSSPPVPDPERALFESGADHVDSLPGSSSDTRSTPQLRSAMVSPMSADSFAVAFTIDRAARERLDEARALLGHAVRDGDLGAIFSRGLEALVAQLRKRTYAETDAPRTVRPTRPGSRHVPAAVRRAVAQRDERQCTFVAEDGRRCTETARLEFHHEHPFGRGGESTNDNIRLLCSTHNTLRTERDCSRPHIELRTRERRPVPRDLIDLARRGLCQAGFKAAIARNAVACAAAELDSDTTLEALLRRSFQHTRKRGTG